MPAVSVVIPAFDRREWLAATIDSVMAQTFTDHEVIVVDDGSTDGTAEHLAALFGDRIRVISLPRNAGRSVARNTGWALARGDLIAFLDSDDLWLPDKLARQLPRFADPAVDLVHCRVGKTDTSGARLAVETAQLEAEFAAADARGQTYAGLTRTWCRLYTSAVVVRRDVLRRVGGFDPTLANFEDWDLFWRIARDGDVAYIPETLVLHRTHPGNTPTVWAAAAGPWLTVMRRHLSDLAAGPPRPDDARARANLLLNLALGEYWRRDLGASRRWMRRAVGADPAILAHPGHYLWAAPLAHALLPRRLAEVVIARVGPDRYEDVA